MNATAETHEWMYRNLDCVVFALESSEMNRYVGYVTIADRTIEVVDTENADAVASAMDQVESEVDVIVNDIDTNDGQGWQPLDPDDTDIDPITDPYDPNPSPLDPDPPAPYDRYRWETVHIGLDNGSVVDLINGTINSQPFDTGDELDVRYDV